MPPRPCYPLPMFARERRAFLTSLSFLTRLGPAGAFHPQSTGDSLAWFPAVGAVVGGLAFAATLAPLSEWGRAWLSVVVAVWATRGLHHDGLADVADGWGSSADGQRFWDILKDSRTGAFAVLALVLEFGGRLVLTHDLLVSGSGAALVFVAALSRLASAWFGRLHVRLVRPGLGGLFLTDGAGGQGGGRLAVASVCVALLGLATVGPLATFSGAGLATVALWRLSALARARRGINGDFLGAAILLAELGALAGATLTK